MKFETDDNLIDLLVGQNLYTSPDVAMRELLQNAEDACHLQSIVDDQLVPAISVTYSPAENWVEIADNGLGMDQATFVSSFARIGASKSQSPKLQALIQRAGAGARPIGQFGIGILSCFGVADVVEVRTLTEGEEPISFRIPNRREEFQDLMDHRADRGTTLRLELKPGGPMDAHQVPDAISRYVRHARHITIKNYDTGEAIQAPEQWLEDARGEGSTVNSPLLEEGHFQLSDGWDSINQPLDVQLVYCNGGFLVSNNVMDALPAFVVGIRGEMNVRPGALTILMNREGFQQDDRWNSLTLDIVSHYQQLLKRKLTAWRDANVADIVDVRAAQRAVLLLARTQVGQAAGADVMQLAKSLLPRFIRFGEPPEDLRHVMERAGKKPPLYVYKSDDETKIQRQFNDDGGQSYSMIDEISSLDLRVTLLSLNGYVVVKANRHDYTVQFGGRNFQINTHEFDAISELCGEGDIPLQTVQNAPAEHTKIGYSRDAEAITDIFQLSSDIKIQSVGHVDRPVISDFNGYILNSANPTIRRILEIMPDAVGNPVRKELMMAYFAISAFDMWKARDIIFQLLVDEDFLEKASRRTGRYLREYFSSRIKSLLSGG